MDLSSRQLFLFVFFFYFAGLGMIVRGMYPKLDPWGKEKEQINLSPFTIFDLIIGFGKLFLE